MIKSLNVYGLFGRGDYELTLHPDLNILTGRNGSGKTTLLKLMWYMISPNIERITPEISFREAEVTTDEFSLNVSRASLEPQAGACFSYQEGNTTPLKIDLSDQRPGSRDVRYEVERINDRIKALPSGSVFFPTFRRIEGGFSIGRSRPLRGYPDFASGRLVDVVSDYAQSIGVGPHRFVAYISTDDIEELLMRQYANVSERTNELHLAFSKFITMKVAPTSRRASGGASSVEPIDNRNATELLNDIRTELGEVDRNRAELMKPFDVLGRLVERIFKDKGIIVSESLRLGETGRAIKADILSAGEKQLLSLFST